MAVSYDEHSAPVLDRRFTAEAAAGLRTTSADLARFAAALMPGPNGEPPGRGVLAPQTVARMIEAQPASRSDEILRGSEWGLGFGLKRLAPGGRLLVYHPGDNIPGFHNMLAAIPERRIGVVVLTNGAAGRSLRTEVLCEWLRAVRERGVAECETLPP
jgi:CubicO group peptidase (beta-lactamase class C family)